MTSCVSNVCTIYVPNTQKQSQAKSISTQSFVENVFSIEKLCIYLSCNLYKTRGGRHQARHQRKVGLRWGRYCCFTACMEMEEMFILQKLKLNIVYEGKRYLRTEYTDLGA